MFGPQQGEEPGQLHHGPPGRPNGQIGVPFGRNSRHRDPVTRPPGRQGKSSATDADTINPGLGTAIFHGDRSLQIGVASRRFLPSGPRRYGGHRTTAESPRKGLALRPWNRIPPGRLPALRADKVRRNPAQPDSKTKDARASLPPMIILGEQPAGTLDLERALPTMRRSIQPAGHSNEGGETRRPDSGRSAT